MDKKDKRIRFEKVASKRVQKVLDTLDLLSNCANKSNYDFNERDVEQMFNEISRHLRDCKNAYAKAFSPHDGKKGFTFDN